MSQYCCPLCNQEVTRAMFEKITGIWDAKEKSLKQLKLKEKKLKEKEKALVKKFDLERKSIIAKKEIEKKKQIESQKKIFLKELEKQKGEIKREKQKVQKEFQRKLIEETTKSIKKTKEDFDIKLKSMKEILLKSTENKFKKERIALERQKELFKKKEKIALDKTNKLLIQYKSLQTKSQAELLKANKKILSLEEQVKKNKTPQVLGLLEEKIFLEELRKNFPGDKFLHTGKGGDILHQIMLNEHVVGKIIYELKKVSAFNNSYITQTYEAKQQREADYGLLIINANRSKTDSGYSIAKGIFIVHPAGALVLISILRENLLQIHNLKLGKTEKDKAIKEVMEYIQSPIFVNSMESIIKDTIDLYDSLKKEVKDHLKSWELRFQKYKSINKRATVIDGKFNSMLAREISESKRQISGQKIESISLPDHIS
ncbi:hypothetical protein [Leptospira koniambonensis]|uniref:hypothetical protein n=1 Tax=Leptospira koniambonensis TaxID=2484950 RepID=UPI003EBA5713